MQWRSILLSLAILVAAASGCSTAPPPQVWCASDMVQLSEQTTSADSLDTWVAQTRTVDLCGAANETVSFQLVIDAPPEGARGVTLAVGDLRSDAGKIDRANVALFRMLPVKMEQYPAWYLRLCESTNLPERCYDALAPVGAAGVGQPYTLGGNDRLAVWVDVSIPRDAAAGKYTAAVTVTSAAGPVTLGAAGLASQTINVQLEVFDFVLPDAHAVAAIGSFSDETIFNQFIPAPPGGHGRVGSSVPARLDPDNKDVKTALVHIRELMRLGHAHRLDLFDRAIHPILKRDADGQVALGWEDYDNIVRPYLDGSAFDDHLGVAAWPAPFSAAWPDAGDYGGAGTPAYRATAIGVLDQTVRHFVALGADEKLFIWPRTGSRGADAYARHVALASLARAGKGMLPILSEMTPVPPVQTGWEVPPEFGTLADMYAPPADVLDPAALRQLTHRPSVLAGVWLRPGTPPWIGSCGVLGSPCDIRALGWLAMKYRCGGLFLPEVLNWAGNPFQAAAGSDDRLFYPGNVIGLDGVLPSVRLKRLRRGLEDTAYLWLLHQKKRDAQADAITNMMVHYAALDAAGDHYLDPRMDGWVKDPQIWVKVRRLLAQEVRLAIRPDLMGSRELFDLRLAWRQLQREACRVRAERVVARVDLQPGELFKISLTAQLFNETTDPAEVELKIDALPKDWKYVVQNQRLDALAGQAKGVLELSLAGAQIPTDADGKFAIPLTMTTALGGPEKLSASVPFLRVGVATSPPTIDGDLRDWPMRSGSSAGAFKILGRRGRIGTGLAERQTQVFAMHDDKNLYLAFRCEEPDLGNLHALTTNQVHYDQLLCSGEDLVEIVLDPTHAAKGAQDLYHLLIKCNGVVVAQRGVATDPPLGASGPWNVSPKLAVARQEGSWTVELAIPLEAFGPDAQSKLWSVNFMRFATAGDEASSWAGEDRYFYNPATLGAMYLLPKENPLGVK